MTGSELGGIAQKADKFVLEKGDVDWKEVRKALREIGYENHRSAEMNDDDPLQAEELSRRFGRISAGEDLPKGVPKSV
jgi:sugar phosphate isomerase/epimerase